MALDVLPPSADRFRLHPVEPRHAAIFCFALLTLSCALASFALACATSFAAFAVIRRGSTANTSGPSRRRRRLAGQSDHRIRCATSARSPGAL
jgi:hypothetical protein